MKSILLFPLCCFLVNYAFAQRVEQVKKYVNLVDHAEIACCNQQFAQSDSLYALALNQRVYIHTKDFYNACQSALLFKNYNHASLCMDSLVLRGFSLNYFMLKYAFKEFRKTVFWTDFIARYPELKERYQRQINWAWRNVIESRYVQDQYLALDDLEENRGKREKLFYENATLFQQEIVKNGYPTDAKIGVFFTKSDTVYETFSPVEVMLYHTYQKRDFRLTPLLKSCLENGEIEPEFFISCYYNELNQHDPMSPGYGLPSFWNINDTLYQRDYPQEVLQQVNKNRQNVLGSAYDSYMQKSAFFVLKKANSWRFIMGATTTYKMGGLSPGSVISFRKLEFLKVVDDYSVKDRN